MKPNISSKLGRFASNKLLIAALVVAMIGILSGMSFAQAAAVEAAEQQAASQAILNTINQDGQALVYVSLKVDTARTAALDVRKAAVASAQSAVLASLSGADFQVTRQYQLAHGLAGYVNSAAGLNALLSNSLVNAVVLSPEAATTNLEAGQLVNADDVWALGYTGAGVRVAVMDTGIDDDHPDLEDSVIGLKCFVSNQSGCPGGEANQAPDTIGHGSHVAGTITSNGDMAVIGEPGLAPDAGVYAVKVFGNDGGGTGVDILAAIDWVGANQGTLDIDIVNMSLGFPSANSGTHCDTSFDAFFDDLFISIGDMDTITFIAAGNNGSKTTIGAPACFSNVISVGAVYTGNFGGIGWSACTDPTTAADQVTCFSQSAPILDILAPGALMDSTVPNDTYDSYGGTSMASPASAAVGALLLEVDPSLTQSQMLTILQDTGVDITDDANGQTNARINALAAVEEVEGNPTNTPGGPTETPEPTATPTEEVPDGDLLSNNSFESLDGDGKPDLASWTVKNSTGDKGKCNKDKDGDGIPDKIFSFSGDCAFVFKGGPGESSSIQQSGDLSGVVFSPSDLIYSAFALAKNDATATGKVKLVIKYNDTTDKSKISGGLDELPTGGDYVFFEGTIGLLSTDVNKMKFSVKNTSASGKVLLDDVYLFQNPPTVAGGTPGVYSAKGSGLIAVPQSNDLGSRQ